MKVDGQRGVTLLELLVLLGALGVVVGSATPWTAGLLRQLETRSGAVRVASALTRARYGALAEGRSWTVRVLDERTFEVGPLETRRERQALPQSVRFLDVNSGGDVRFSSGGGAENATFVIGNAVARRVVVVNQRGRVSVREAGR